MLRGINKQAIFSDDEDNEKFLYILEDCKAISEFELYGYCLMGNHVHLLMKECKEPLELVLKRIGTRYVYWYNNKYARIGHLFQDRYRSEAVESDPYFSVVLRYIHQNPKKAALCKLISEYKWSSYKNYISKSGIIDTGLALEIIGKSNFESFMNEDKDDICLDDTNQERRVSDEEIAAIIEKKLKVKAIMIQNEPKKARNDLLREALRIDGISTRQLSRVTGISANIIWAL